MRAGTSGARPIWPAPVPELMRAGFGRDSGLTEPMITGSAKLSLRLCWVAGGIPWRAQIDNRRRTCGCHRPQHATLGAAQRATDVGLRRVSLALYPVCAAS
jgi:hypothetical protein